MKFEWELLKRSEDKISETWRAKVIGGWIIKEFDCIYVDNLSRGSRDYSLSNSIIFIPDKNHEWDLNEEEYENKSIDELELLIRTYNNLRALDIVTIGDLIKWSSLDLLKTINFGKKSLFEVKEALKKIGLKLKE